MTRMVSYVPRQLIWSEPPAGHRRGLLLIVKESSPYFASSSIILLILLILPRIPYSTFRILCVDSGEIPTQPWPS